jgi:hypothetical protein
MGEEWIFILIALVILLMLLLILINYDPNKDTTENKSNWTINMMSGDADTSGMSDNEHDGGDSEPVRLWRVVFKTDVRMDRIYWKADHFYINKPFQMER